MKRQKINVNKISLCEFCSFFFAITHFKWNHRILFCWGDFCFFWFLFPGFYFISWLFFCLWWWWYWCSKIALFSSSCGLLLDFVPNKFTRKTIKWNVIEISCFCAKLFWLRIFFWSFTEWTENEFDFSLFFVFVLRKIKLFS